jgi:carbamoyltransferase
VVVDGVVVSAIEEERLNRVKGGKSTHLDNTLILPFQSINVALSSAGITFKDVDLIATSFSPDRRKIFSKEWAKHAPVLEGEYETPVGDQTFRRLIELAPQVLAARFGVSLQWVEDRFKWVPHHIAHIASAYFPSGFADAAAMTIDGIGEFETAALADCVGGQINILEEARYPNSLGFLWEVLTSFLGFESNHDESKIMGLAAYGNPETLRSAFGSLISIDEEGRFATHLDATVLKDNYSTIERLLGVNRRLPYEPLAWQGRDRRHANLAAALQEATNEVFVRQAQALRRKTGRKYLAMAGGVCLNCVANGHVAERSGFEDIYVQPATGDAGTSVGAALYLHHVHSPDSGFLRASMPTPFLGPSFDDDRVRAALEKFRLGHERIDKPSECAAELLVAGSIVGWFQGAMEFGPRALGNRSLLANPSLPGVRHILNLQVKHREEFRPFCPTILAEDASEWLEHSHPLSAASRVMLMTYKIKHAKRPQVPAVLHMDGSSRVQVLHRADNVLFYELVAAFKRRTGIPLVLNTSFNDNEPIVCTPEDACKCYLKTRFDAMILGNYLVKGPKPWERDPEASFFEIASRRFDERLPATPRSGGNS